MCVVKKTLMLTMIAFCLPNAQAQLQLFLVDSSFTTKDYGEVGASFTRRNGKQKLTENAGGDLLNGSIDYYCSNCKINSDGRFTFDRSKVYNNGSEIVIHAFKNGDKYTDTLRLHVPRPIAVSALKNKTNVTPSESIPFAFQFLFDNGESVSTNTHAHLLKTVRFRDLPPEFGVEKGQLFFSATKYYDSCQLSYYIDGLPHVGGRITVYPQYNYTRTIEGKGNRGQKGNRGSSGYSGSGSTPNGQNGQSGGNGGRGNDADDMTIKLKTLPSGIVKVEVERARLVREEYYLDFEAGARLNIDLSGGDGGEGGEGGDGGSGNNATERYAAGYGGNGGEGGYGGNGGRGGYLTVYADSTAYKFIDRLTLFNRGGRGGYGGRGGSGGKGGSDNNARLIDILITGRRGNGGGSGGQGNDGQNGYPMTVHIKS